MKRISVWAPIAALTFALTGTASASDIFNFTADAGSSSSSYGNSLTFSETVGSLTVTASAWYLPANFASGSTFSQAALDNYNGTNLGLGVCSPNDPSGANCGSPYHQIGNNNGDEFVVFHFSQAVNLNGASVSITNYAPIGSTSDVDLTYYTAQTGLTTSTTLGSLGGGTTINQNCTGTACQGTPYSDVLSTTGTSSYLIVAAAVVNSDGFTDAFKLNGISIPSASATPEPGTLSTISLALCAIGFAAWRKRKQGMTLSAVCARRR